MAGRREWEGLGERLQPRGRPETRRMTNVDHTHGTSLGLGMAAKVYRAFSTVELTVGCRLQRSAGGDAVTVASTIRTPSIAVGIASCCSLAE